MMSYRTRENFHPSVAGWGLMLMGGLGERGGGEGGWEAGGGEGGWVAGG